MPLLLVYVFTLAPGLTFWDAGEFITAAHVLGIPHPPGTPLFVAIGRVWTLLTGSMFSVARAMNLLSALCTAGAAAVSAWMIAYSARARSDSAIGAIAGALCAGLMLSVWANATETEVYAVALLHSLLLIGAAYRASIAGEETRPKWLLLVGYLIALIPALHLSVMLAAPAALVLAARNAEGEWNHRSTALLVGVTLMTVGVGRMSVPLTMIGALCTLGAGVGGRERHDVEQALGGLGLTVLGVSALAIMLVRARAGAPLNQGDPSTLASLAGAVGRRQYDIAPLWPRRIPVWLQLANVGQYFDWQVAMGWGNGVFTSVPRLIALLLFVFLSAIGYRELRRDSRRMAEALAVLLVCGTIGVAGYLNMRAGASIGYGMVPADQHEARERDYFFVLGFWAWGLLAGYGALAFTRARRWRCHFALLVPLLPLFGNWRVVDRSAGVEASAPHDVATALLNSAPPNAVLFLAGDNDTYPVWYLQLVEGVRTDVTTVTVPLLGADWYSAQIAQRTGLKWNESQPVAGADFLHLQRAALIARAAVQAGRPVLVTTQVPAAQRKLLGSSWFLTGVVYQAANAADGSSPRATFIEGKATPLDGRLRDRASRLPDDVSRMMLGSLECGRLGAPRMLSKAARDSLETTCNLR